MRLLYAQGQQDDRTLGLFPADGVAAAPRYLSARTIHAGSRGTCGSVAHRFRGLAHRLQPLRTLQRDESHRLLLFCRSVV